MKFDVFDLGDSSRFYVLRMTQHSHQEIRDAADARGQTVDELFACAIAAELGGCCELGGQTRQDPLFDGAAHAAPMNVRGRRKGEVRAVRRGAETLWTVAQAADRAGLGRSTIGRAIAYGEIGVIRPTIGGKSIQIPEHQLAEFCRLYLPGYTAKNAKRNG